MCHAERGCSQPASDRLARNDADECIGCHMPKVSSFDIPHAASANHRIPRYAGAGNQLAARPAGTGQDTRRLVIFHRERMGAEERAEVERDRGVALCHDGPDGARVALPLLEAALAARPDDGTGWECKGYALGGLGRYNEALEAFRKALALEPGRESALVGAARLATKANRRQDAATYWRRAIAINAWRSDYHAELALEYFREGNWQASADCCRKALRLNSSGLKIRKLLVQCCLNLGDIAAARREFDSLLGFDPPDRADLLRSFSVQSRSGSLAP
jgi:tetratricopeptide (TPR) repeat protein